MNTSIGGRFWVKLISSQALTQYMSHRGFTIRSLAAKVGCSHSVVGHLCSGKRVTCMPETAKKIERALDAPAGSLFVPQVSRVSQDMRTVAA